MPSFDIVSEVNEVEIRNAVEQTNKEVSTRFDFKGTDARIEQAGKVLTVFADNDFQLEQVKEILVNKMAKRGVDIRCLDEEKLEKVSGNKVKQLVTVKTGIETELAKKLSALSRTPNSRFRPVFRGMRCVSPVPSAICYRRRLRWCVNQLMNSRCSFRTFVTERLP